MAQTILAEKCFLKTSPGHRRAKGGWGPSGGTGFLPGNDPLNHGHTDTDLTRNFSDTNTLATRRMQVVRQWLDGTLRKVDSGYMVAMNM